MFDVVQKNEIIFEDSHLYEKNFNIVFYINVTESYFEDAKATQHDKANPNVAASAYIYEQNLSKPG